MSRLSLAATGWVEPDVPIGNRLRWSWPDDAGGHRILPEKILVERADIPIDVDAGLIKLYGPAAGVATDKWQYYGDKHLAGHTPVQVSLDELAGVPVQAVWFCYQAHVPSTGALVQGFDGERCVVTQWVSDGEMVVLQAASIDRLTVMTAECVLKGLKTLDLYAPTTLDFATIAEVDLSATAGASLGEVQPRYHTKPTLDVKKWGELQQAWNAAWAEAPGTVGADGGPNAWDVLQISLAARWEHAVLCGLGFVDGPPSAEPVLDIVEPYLLANAKSVAYRVRDLGDALAPSNVVYVPGFPAPDLILLPDPTIEEGAVRLGQKDGSEIIRASWEVAWESPDPRIVGVHVEETLMVGGKSSIETYDGRGRRETDPPGAGFVRREDVAVETHTVIVSARVRPQDGFDRLGPWGKHSPPTTLPIDHYPQPPLFSTATSDGTNTTLTHDGVWSPDEIVASANGGVHFFCRIKDPVRYSAKVEEVIPSEDVLIVKLGVKPGESPPPTATFTGGQISIHTVHGDVLALSGEILLAAWPWVFAEVRHGDGPSVAISIGDTAQLAQSPTHADLFKHVHHEQAVGLQHAITFKDKMPDPTEVQLLEYRARIEFAGQMGPFGPAAQALRMPATPNVPPPFEVTTLGVDFYDRTVVLLQLTEPSDDLLEIWWAAGVFPSEPGKPNLQFSRNAVPGDAGVRGAEGGKVLFDTLSLPVPGKVPRSVTIGVQAVNGADGRSEFETVVHTLPAS